nr:hypothetical protein [Clostridioides sp.]
MKNTKVYIKDKDQFRKIIESQGFGITGFALELKKSHVFFHWILHNNFVGYKSAKEVARYLNKDFDELFEIR